MRPWYVRRVEGFLKARRPTSLSRVTASEVAGYLQKVADRGQLADWQFQPLADALQLLFVDLGQCPAGKEIDWDWCKAGGCPLQEDHPTIARSGSPAAGPADGPSFARAAEEVPLLKTLARTVRAMQYSIRTERAYIDWCHRFLAFCGETPPGGCAAVLRSQVWVQPSLSLAMRPESLIHHLRKRERTGGGKCGFRQARFAFGFD